MSAGYISCERDGDYDAIATMPGDCQHLLDLAEQYGWDDREARWAFECASHPDDDDPTIGTVTTEQAERFAEALERALPDIPGHDAKTHKLRKPAWAGKNASDLEEDDRNPLTPLEWFSGDEKEYVRNMIAFCRDGGFRVVFERW